MTNNLILVREVELNDRMQIWKWWNDPVTRKMMKKNDDVPWQVHCKWFDGVLKDENKILIIGSFKDDLIGNTRFDFQEEGVYEMSINMNPQFRGKGFGTNLLRESVQLIYKLRKVELIFATLKKNNIASKRAFEKAGFDFKDVMELSYPGLKEYIPNEEYYCEISVSCKEK